MDHAVETRHTGQTTGWVGWIAFASTIMVLAGFFQAIYGLAALFQNNIIISGSSQVWLLSLTSWGWVHIILGVLLVGVGLGLVRGGTFSRVMAVIIVGLSALANFLFIPVYPIWSIIVLTVDALIIFAIVAHGSELRDFEG